MQIRLSWVRIPPPPFSHCFARGRTAARFSPIFKCLRATPVPPRLRRHPGSAASTGRSQDRGCRISRRLPALGEDQSGGRVPGRPLQASRGARKSLMRRSRRSEGSSAARSQRALARRRSALIIWAACLCQSPGHSRPSSRSRSQLRSCAANSGRMGCRSSFRCLLCLPKRQGGWDARARTSISTLMPIRWIMRRSN